MTTLSEAACQLLEGANFGHLATLQPDGAPKVDPVWVGREGNLVLIATDGGSLKAKNVLADPRVALSVIAYDDPYRQLLIRGRVTERRADDDLAALDALAQKYLGSLFPRRRWSERLVLAITPDVVRTYKSSLRHEPGSSDTKDSDPAQAPSTEGDPR